MELGAVESFLESHGRAQFISNHDVTCQRFASNIYLRQLLTYYLPEGATLGALWRQAYLHITLMVSTILVDLSF